MRCQTSWRKATSIPSRWSECHDIEVPIPDQDDRDPVHRVIYKELCLGRIEDVSRQAYRTVMQSLVGRGGGAGLGADSRQIHRARLM